GIGLGFPPTEQPCSALRRRVDSQHGGIVATVRDVKGRAGGRGSGAEHTAAFGAAGTGSGRIPLRQVLPSGLHVRRPKPTSRSECRGEYGTWCRSASAFSQ